MFRAILNIQPRRGHFGPNGFEDESASGAESGLLILQCKLFNPGAKDTAEICISAVRSRQNVAK